MTTQDSIFTYDDVDDLHPDQKIRLNGLFKFISSKAGVDYSNREMQDIQAAVCAMLSRISTRVNERGIFNISGIQPCGSHAEKSSVWKVDRETGHTYTEFDFLAVLQDTVNVGKEQSCGGCLEVEKTPMRIKLLKRYHSRTTNFDEMVETSLESPSILSNLFWQELIWCISCLCTCLMIKFYDISGRCYANDVFDGIFTKVEFEPSTANFGCDYCVVKMQTGTLSVDTSTAVDQVSKTPAKCSLIFRWISNSRCISAPNKLLTRRKQVKCLQIYVDFLPALQLTDPETSGNRSNHRRYIVPKYCGICGRPGRWLISSCVSEINTILREMSDKHRQCFKIVKYLLPILDNSHNGNSFNKINTYHMKNIALRHSQNCTVQTDDVQKCILNIFLDLYNAYKTKKLVSVFLQLNLLENANNKYFTESMALAYKDYIERVFTVSESDSWKTYIERVVCLKQF